MSTVEAPGKVAPTMDKLTNDWFDELQKALNSAKRLKRVFFSDERLGTTFQKAYAQMRKHLGDLEATGAYIKGYQDQYDAIVKLAEDAKGKHSTGGVKEALTKVTELDKQLIIAKKKQKAMLEKRSWNPKREEVAKAIADAEDNWLTQKTLAPFEIEIKKILTSALNRKSTNGKDFLPSDEDTEKAFTLLLENVNARVVKAQKSKKTCGEHKAEAKKALATFKKTAGPSDVEAFQSRFDKAEALIEDDNNYFAAGKKFEQLATDINLSLGAVKNAESDYKKSEEAVTKSLAELKKVTSEAVHARYEGRLHASQRDAELGEYVVANEALVKLLKDIGTRCQEATQAKSDWTNSALRKELASKAKTYRESRNENPYFALVANLGSELGVIESTATGTHDYERAGRELLALETSLKNRELAIAKLKNEGEPDDLAAARSEMAKAQADVDDALDALSEKFGQVRPTQGQGEPMAFIRLGDDDFRGKLVEIKMAVDKAVISGDRMKILAAYTDATKDLKAVAIEANKLDGDLLEKYKERLKEQRETLEKTIAARKLYTKAHDFAEQALLRLEDTGAAEPGSLRTDFDKFADPKNISNANAGADYDDYAKKFDLLTKDIEKALQTNTNLVTTAVKELKEEIEKAKLLCKKHSKEKSRKKYCEHIEAEVVKLEPVLHSTQVEVLKTAKEHAEKFVAKLEALSTTAKQNELVAQRTTLARLKKALKVKDVKKYMPNTRESLLVAHAAAATLVYSGEPADKALQELETKVNSAGTDAGVIKGLRKKLDKRLSDIKGDLKNLTDKIVAYAKKDKNLKNKKGMKGKSFGEYQTQLDEIKIKAKGEDPKLFTEALKLAEQLSVDLQSASPAALAAAEGKQIDKDKIDKEQWKGELNTVLNGVFKEAKKRAEETKDKSGEKMLDELLKQANKAADNKEYRAAQSQLEGIKRQAANMIGAAVGVHGSKKLEPLKAAWSKSLSDCRKKLKLLAAAIEKETDIEIDGQKLAQTTVAKQVASIKKALAKFSRTAFDDSIDKLMNEENDQLRRAAREKGLSLVRLYQRRLHEDPVMHVLNRKAFGVVTPLKNLHDVLGRLDLLLQINN